MIRLPDRVPKRITIACSGGSDSMVAIDFFLRGKKDIRVAHFDHKTQHSEFARAFVEKFCKDRDLDLVVGELNAEKEKGIDQLRTGGNTTNYSKINETQTEDVHKIGKLINNLKETNKIK